MACRKIKYHIGLQGVPLFKLPTTFPKASQTLIFLLYVSASKCNGEKNTGAIDFPVAYGTPSQQIHTRVPMTIEAKNSDRRASY